MTEDGSERDISPTELVETIYQRGVSLEDERDVYGNMINRRFLPLYAETQEPADVSKDVQEALVELALNYHYAHTAELIICGRIVEHSSDLPTKRIGLLLGLSHLSYVDTWGSYLSKQAAGIVVDETLKEHYATLFSETNTSSLLVGLCVVGAITGRVVMRETENSPEPLYNRISETIGFAKREDQEMITAYLQHIWADSENYPFVHVEDDAEQYLQQAKNIIMQGEDRFETLGINHDTISSRIEEETRSFFEAIGLL